MEKKEYLKKLKENLNELEKEELNKIVNTYRNKINTLIKSGLTEKEALKKVGSVDKITKLYLKKDEGKVISKKDEKPAVKNKKSLTKETKKEVTKKTSKVKDNEIKQKKVIISGNQTEITEDVTPIKPYNVILKEFVNLAFLLISLTLLYYPFNMVNINMIKTISFFTEKVGYLYLSSFVIYSLYLIICIVSLGYYISYIADNKEIEKVNIVTNKIKIFILKLLVFPAMIFIVAATELLIISLFFYADGFNAIGVPILCLGLLLFACLIYMSLRNKLLKRQISMYVMFCIYLIPLIIMGTGAVLSYKRINQYSYHSDINSRYIMKMMELNYVFPEGNDTFKIYFNTNYNTQYTLKYDKKLNEKIKVELTYYKSYFDLNESHDKNGAYISLSSNYRRKLSLFLENIKDDKILNYDELERYEVIIYVDPDYAKRLIIEN